ncbi:MAG: 3-deoxy-D-manno-octulosonic acid transferase [Sulfitobacter sp.]|nr:3-deoxy-D-manno-octulosonic acid transferase [Sulfitobacter sp.]
MPAPLAYSAWVGLSRLLLPYFGRREVAKLRRAGLPRERACEKLGHASAPRPDGQLIWFHAASVGESLSVLSLITAMGARLPGAQFLLTSGTATSAQLIAQRMPPRCRHQFAPLDAPGPLRRFLGHWRPDAAIFVESELWPQMLRRTHATGAAMALVNARLSQKTLAAWARRPALARHLFEVFSLILTQNATMAEALKTLGAPTDRIAAGINLKSLSAPLPVDEALLAEGRAALGERPTWVAASTHPGEEAVVLKAHARLRERLPEARLILVPRHPDRGREVAELIALQGLDVSRRSQGAAPGGTLYLADTLGELGTWYALTDLVFLGGSLRPIGGHNPFEVAQAGAMTLSGNHVANFAETFSAMEACGAALLVADAQDLADKVETYLGDADLRAKARKAAEDFTAAQGSRLEEIADRLIAALKLGPT